MISVSFACPAPNTRAAPRARVFPIIVPSTDSSDVWRFNMVCCRPTDLAHAAGARHSRGCRRRPNEAPAFSVNGDSAQKFWRGRASGSGGPENVTRILRATAVCFVARFVCPVPAPTFPKCATLATSRKGGQACCSKRSHSAIPACSRCDLRAGSHRAPTRAAAQGAQPRSPARSSTRPAALPGVAIRCSPDLVDPNFII